MDFINGLYTNIGNKIMTMAKVLGILSMFCVFVGLILWVADGSEGLLVLISGVASFLGTWPLYAFGQLVNDVHDTGKTSGSEEEELELPDI